MNPLIRSSDPATWRRFAFQLSAILLVGIALLAWREGISAQTAVIGAVAVAMFLTVGLLRPTWVRPVHAGSVAVSEWMGKYLGGIGLMAFFLLILTPLGLVLRLIGYDPLRLRCQRAATSYWQKAPKHGPLNRMF